MSLSASKAAWLAKSPAVEKLVLLCLADHANRRGRCWPSIARIGELCGLHRTAVMRSLQALMKAGHIEIERSVGRQNRYLVRPLEPDTSRTALPVAESDQSHRATGTSNVTGRSPLRDRSFSATPPVAQSDPNLLRTYKEPITKNRGRTKFLPKTPDFHQEIIRAYHELCPDLPQVKLWTDGRRSSLEARIAERKASGKPADTIGYWRSLFQQVASSDFLCGRSADWRADLAWLLKPENFAKTIEGRYSGKRSTNGARVHG